MESKTINISKELMEKILDPEKLKHCFECGICTASCPIARLISKHYNPRILLQTIVHDLDRAITETEPWLCAWCDRCYKRCPQGLNLPEIFMLARNIAKERGYLSKFSEGLQLIGREMPFAGVCGLVCFGKVEDLKATELLKQYVTEYEQKREEQPVLIFKKHRDKVAIIGSGPAGLTAAYDLAIMGYPVTVFEALPKAGGMLRIGIPEFRLPRTVLDTEIQHMEKLGVNIKTNVLFGKDVTIGSLFKDGYKAIFIAIGAQKSRNLRIKGEQLKGVVHAIDLLKDINLGKKVELGNKVAVIGGGNVAIDAARNILRLGVKEVTILYRRSKEEMPANSWEVREAEKEDVKIQFLTAPKRILSEDDQLVALECIRMELGEPDESGRRRPIPVEGSEFTVELDMLILAIGESPDYSLLPKAIKIAEQKTIIVNPLTLETSISGVFAGGDVVTGPATVVEAIVAGKKAANSINGYLTGEAHSKEKQ